VGKRKNNTLSVWIQRISGKKKPMFKRDCSPSHWLNQEYGISVMNATKFIKGWKAHLSALGCKGVVSYFFLDNLTITKTIKSLTSDFISKLMKYFVTSLAMEKQEAKEDAQEEANKPCLCGLYDAPVLAVAPVAKPYKA
jgi:hypothetical protein